MSFDEQEVDPHDECIEEIARLNKWVRELQSGMFINCVYCGHRYGPGKDTSVVMGNVLKAHVKKCPKHPLALAYAARDAAERCQDEWRELDKLSHPEATAAARA